jgi:pimeloyl-ACP methyl ester carboxylesterase
MAIPVTAFLEFSNQEARLEFVPTYRRETIQRDGSSVRLAADFSAPLALILSKGKNRAIDIQAFLRTDAYIDRAALLQFQPYDPKKIPVIFVHGLLSRPEAWTKALNTLLADPEIRKKYQFWFFIYPTGLPIWQSAAILRAELKRFDAVLDPDGSNPLLRQKILVGHSMGGIISSLIVRKGGHRLWSQFSDRSLQDMADNPRLQAQVQEMVFFEPRKDVDRVIFVATPHRGSPLALRSFAGFFAGLVRLPMTPWLEERPNLLELLREDVRTVFEAPANSVRILRSNSPILLSVLNLPMAREIPYHSILGNRGRRGPIEKSSDGIVPYWSSQMPGAASEKIVPSGHGVNEHPEGIQEIRRILKENLNHPQSP